MNRPLLFRYAEAIRSDDPDQVEAVLAEHGACVKAKTKEIEGRDAQRSLRVTYKDLSAMYTRKVLLLSNTADTELDRTKRGSKRSKTLELPNPFNLIVVQKDFDRSGIVSYSFSFANVNEDLIAPFKQECVYSTPDVFAIAGGDSRYYDSAGGLARIFESADSLRTINAVARSRSN